MSMLVCPLCGKQSSLRRFDPSGFHEDIIAIEKRGLGRGMGFEEVARYSLLGTGSPALSLIKDRVLVLVEVLDIGSRVPSERSLRAELEDEALAVKVEGLEQRIGELLDPLNEMTRERNRLRGEVEALEVEVEELRQENASLSERLDEQENECENCEIANGLCTEIDEVLNMAGRFSDTALVDSTECLIERVHYILREYEAMAVE